MPISLNRDNNYVRIIVVKRLLKLLLIPTLCLAFISYSLSETEEINFNLDMTSKLEVLGQPFSFSEYPSNIWDMQAYGDRIYLGCGNSSNNGPAANAGPVPVVYYDTVKSRFVTLTTIPEEQIDIYRMIDGKLVIPGHDSKESWSFGNFYTIEEDACVKSRTVKDAVHNYDMAYFNGNLFAATGTAGFGTALMSGDMGKTWVSLTPGKAYKEGKAPLFYSEGRAYSIFQFKDKLYFTGILYNGYSYYNNFLCVDDKADIKTAATGTSYSNDNGLSIVRASKMVPNAPRNTKLRMVRINEINKKLIYISGISDNDHQWLPDALYVASDINRAKRITLPEKAALPMDILSRDDNTVYVLTHVRTDQKKYINIIYQSKDLYRWRECFRFESDTFARSFELLNGDFYFGLGCHTDNLSTSAGEILRIKASDIQTNRKYSKKH